MSASDDHDQHQEAARRGWRRPFTGRAPRTGSVLLATGVLVVCLTPFAVAGPVLEGVFNGTGTKETQIIGNVKKSSGRTGGFTTRQSNKSTSGGAAIYGCRSNSRSSSEPCLRINNLSNGDAFSINADKGSSAGSITVGKGGNSKRPFTTNATGVASGLNADRLDGKSASTLTAEATAGATLLNAVLNPFAQVAANGTPAQVRGVPDGGVTNPAGGGTYTVVFRGDMTKCALSGTLNGSTSGQIAVSAVAASDGLTTTVDVRTFSGIGTAQDRAFFVAASC